MTGVKSRRKDVKKAWLGIRMIIRMGDCTSSEMKTLVRSEKEFYNKLIEPSTETANEEDVMRRRKQCEESEDMQEILQLFWFVASQERNTISNELTKEGYLHFNLRIQRALIGSDFLENQASEFAEAEYFSDIAAFGPMVEQAFNDVVLELIDTWAENAGQFFRSAFAWALFDCIVSHTSYPPRFRDLMYIKTIADTAEKDLLKRYSKGISDRYRINHWFNFLKNKRFSPDTHDRLVHRKTAVQLPASMADMLIIMGRQAMTNAKLAGASTHTDNNIHDIYKPKEDENLSLKSTVHSIMMMMPKKKKLLPVAEADTDDNSSKASGNSSNSSVRVSKFPIQNITKQNIMKNSKGKDVLALTIAAKLLYKGETSRRQSILNSKTISVSAFLHDIRHLITDGTNVTEGKVGTSPDKEAESSIEDDEPDKEVILDVNKMDEHQRVQSPSKQGLVIDLHPIKSSLSHSHVTDENLQSSHDIDLGDYTRRTNFTDDLDLHEDDEVPKSGTGHKHKPMVVKDMHFGVERKMKIIHPTKLFRKRPTIRIDFRDAWKYQLEDDNMLLDDSSADDSGSCMSSPSAKAGLTVTIKPKSRHGSRQGQGQGQGDQSLLYSPDEESTTLLEFDFQQFEISEGNAHAEGTNERRHSNHSASSTISTTSSYSFMKRMQAPEPESSPLPTTAMQKQYAIKAHRKLVADRLTESLGIHPVPIYQRPIAHLYHEDGKARRVMSPAFIDNSPPHSPLDKVSFSRSPLLPFSPSTSSSPPPTYPMSPLVKSVTRNGSPLEKKCMQTNKKLPPLSPDRFSPEKKSVSYSSSLLRPLPRSSCSASSVMNDSDLDDDSQLTQAFEDEKRGGGAGGTAGDVGNSNESNVFLQENAINDTFSWIKDMPRYLQDTGNIKPLTLRNMSKSCRLGNFVVDEPLDLKDF